MKLGIVTNILAPYRIPLFEAMARQVDDFTVFLMAEREENRQWEIGPVSFKTQLLPGFHLNRKGAEASVHLNYGVVRMLRRFNPDIVMSGGFAPAHIMAYLYARASRKRYVQWGELTLLDGAKVSRGRSLLRRILIGGAAACIASSTTARETFLHYGAQDCSILTTLLPFDVSGLHRRVTLFRSSEEYRLLRRHYPGPILLAVGQLIERKGLKELFLIYARVLAERPDAYLLITGEGPLKRSLELEAQEKGWTHVHFVGHVAPDQLHRVYALGDVFVFPTRYDCFGLVLSEAMAAELPVVSSIHAAATKDLVREGETGFRCDPRDPDGAARKVLSALGLSSGRRAAMGRAAYEAVKHTDIECSADRMICFLRSLLSRPKDSLKDVRKDCMVSRGMF